MRREMHTVNYNCELCRVRSTRDRTAANVSASDFDTQIQFKQGGSQALLLLLCIFEDQSSHDA